MEPSDSMTNAAERSGAMGSDVGVSPVSSRRPPTRGRSVLIMTGMDLAVMSRSWLVRLFLIVSGLVTVFALKGMHSGQAVASQVHAALPQSGQAAQARAGRREALGRAPGRGR